MRLDPDYQYRPAIVRVRITNPASVRQSGVSSVSVGRVLSSEHKPIVLDPGASQTYTFFLTENLDHVDFRPKRTSQLPSHDLEEAQKGWSQEYYATGPKQIGVGVYDVGADGQMHRRSNTSSRAPLKSIHKPQSYVVVLPKFPVKHR